MSVELQSVVDRLELVEQQASLWKLLVMVSLLAAISSIAVTFLKPAAAPAARERVQASVVGANRFVLRDLDGRPAGGMEVRPDGTIRFVLGGGRPTTGAAFLEVQPDGLVHLTLRGPDGTVRAALLAAQTSSLALSTPAQASGATLTALEDGSGALTLRGEGGRIRYRVP